MTLPPVLSSLIRDSGLETETTDKGDTDLVVPVGASEPMKLVIMEATGAPEELMAVTLGVPSMLPTQPDKTGHFDRITPGPAPDAVLMELLEANCTRGIGAFSMAQPQNGPICAYQYLATISLRDLTPAAFKAVATSLAQEGAWGQAKINMEAS